MKPLISINSLVTTINEKSILQGTTLTINEGEVHALMGPNGSGKSSLAFALMGHPNHEITSGNIIFDGEDITTLSPDKRAKKGIFLAFQYPYEIEGIRYYDFLRQTYNALYAGTDRQLGIKAFKERIAEKMKLLNIEESFIERSVNFGFSGGEKKKAEILQLAVLEPRFVILDEIDSGLDIDALKIVCKGLEAIRYSNPSMAFLVITHYQRILHYFKPDFVHVMDKGKIIKSGDATLAQQLEEHGYSS